MLNDRSVSANPGAPSHQDETIFPYARWYNQLPAEADAYARREPFPHAHLTNFLDGPEVDRIVEEFARYKEGPWVRYSHYNEHKSGVTDRRAFPPSIGRLIDELNSSRFVAWLSELTGIRNLLADPSLEGGGMHQCGRGGFLNVHADFTMHHHQKHWRRRVNLIVYLNPAWRSEWGGAIELWDRSMQRAVIRIAPVANDAVIFNTDEFSYHGFPDPIGCPEGTTRNSLALYYYTAEADTAVPRSTNYQARPGDSLGQAGLIWADKQLVRVYSKVKSAVGLSDTLASRMLDFLARRKR